MIAQQPEHPVWAVERGNREVRLTERRLGDRERVDRVALAWLSDRTTGSRHQLGRYPADRLARPEEVDFEPPTQMPTVLQRPAALGPLAGPPPQLEMSIGRRGHGPFAQLPAAIVDRDHCVRPLVQIRSEDDHVHRLLLSRG